MPAYKDKKLGTWYAKFAYTDLYGVRRWTTKRGFLTAYEARLYEFRFKSSNMNHMEFSKTVRFDDFVEYCYLVNPNNIVNKKTKGIIKTKLLPYFKDTRMYDIQLPDIIEWVGKVINMTNQRTGERYSNKYLKEIFLQMKRIMQDYELHYNFHSN